MRDIVVIGSSAGGVETLSRLFGALEGPLPAAFLVVTHLSPVARSMMPALLARVGKLPAQHAVDNQSIKPGCIYIAPPDHHLLLEKNRIRLSHGPKENRHRPAIDPLFRTAALYFGPRVIGIILSGTADDGSMGLKEVKAKGGLAIVQDPSEALFSDMPRNALAAAKPDFCLPVSQISSKLPSLIHGPMKKVMKKPFKDRGLKPENKGLQAAKEAVDKMGRPSVFVCPECSGPLWEVRDDDALLYRCLVGHAYAPQTLLAAQGEEVERALWIALRILEERAEMHRQMAERSKNRHQPFAYKEFLTKGQESARQAKLIRQLLDNL